MPINDFDFTGRTAIVTGASRGIGAAIAQLLETQGATVVRTATQSGQEMVALDFTNEQSIEKFLRYIDGLKAVDILVNNAGINKIDLISDVEDQDWDRIIKVNLTGAERLIKAVSRKMIEAKTNGKIVNISSIFGLITKSKRNAYSASKAGLIGLTRTVSLDLASHGILVNALCPGFVETDMTASILSPADKEQLSANVPLGRFAKEDEIAQAAVYLCSDLNVYMTGQTLVADGGFTIR